MHSTYEPWRATTDSLASLNSGESWWTKNDKANGWFVIAFSTPTYCQFGNMKDIQLVKSSATPVIPNIFLWGPIRPATTLENKSS